MRCRPASGGLEVDPPSNDENSDALSYTLSAFPKEAWPDIIKKSGTRLGEVFDLPVDDAFNLRARVSGIPTEVFKKGEHQVWHDPASGVWARIDASGNVIGEGVGQKSLTDHLNSVDVVKPKSRPTQ